MKEFAEMTCRQVSSGLSAFLDGELSPQEQAGIEAHLAQCPTCQAQREEIASVILRVQETLGSWRVSEDLTTAVSVRLDTEQIIPAPASRKPSRPGKKAVPTTPSSVRVAIGRVIAVTGELQVRRGGKRNVLCRRGRPFSSVMN